MISSLTLLPVQSAEFTTNQEQALSAANNPGSPLDLQASPTGNAGKRSIGAANSLGQPLEAVLDTLPGHGDVRRERFPVSELRFMPERVIAGLTQYALHDEGQRRLCRRFGIPFDYFPRLPSELQMQLLSHHAHQGDFRDSKLSDDNSTLITRGGEVVDLVRDDLLTLPSRDVVRAVQDGLGATAATLRARPLRLSDEAFQLDLLTEERSIEVRARDVLFGGIRVRHSWLGDFATSIEAFVFRLVCSNGLTRLECVQRRTARSMPRTRRLARNQPNAHTLQYEQIRRLTADAWSRLDEKLLGIRRLQGQPFDLHQLERFLQQARLYSARLMARLREAWLAEGNEPTAFGALNALTRLATHDRELSERRRISLERLAGMFAGHSARICPHCLSVLHNDN